MRRVKGLLVLKKSDTNYRYCIEKENIVGERHKREPKDEAQKWRRCSKVWNIMKKGEIMNYIECLHGWKRSVSKSTIKNWNEGMVKIDGVEFSIMEEIISQITGIPIIGNKFYRD